MKEYKLLQPESGIDYLERQRLVAMLNSYAEQGWTVTGLIQSDRHWPVAAIVERDKKI